MQTSQLQRKVRAVISPKRLSRSPRKGSVPLASIEESLKTMPYEEKRRFGRQGSIIFVGILMLITLIIIVVNYFVFRTKQIDTIGAEYKPPVYTANQQ